MDRIVSFLATFEPDLTHLAAIAVVVLAVALLLHALARVRRTGLPLLSRIVASDDSSRAPAKTYRSTRYGLSGRPDFVLKQRGRPIPVEVKALRRGGPRPWDRLQLGVYLLLLEEETGRRPPYGVLDYADGAHRIRYTHRLRQEVLETLAQLRAARARGAGERQHGERGRCRTCGYRSECAEAL